MEKRFLLAAKVSTESPAKVRPVLEKLCGMASIRAGRTPDEFLVETEMAGTSAKELNRALLSELRRAEKRTRLRAEWKSEGTTEKFFDYVPKRIYRPGKET